MEPTKVLVADVEEAHEEIARCLPEAHITCVRTLGDAAEAIAEQRFDLVVIGFHFAAGRMCELIPQVKRHRDMAAVPVICVRLRPAALEPRIRQSIEGAVRALGGSAFLDAGELDAEALCRHL